MLAASNQIETPQNILIDLDLGVVEGDYREEGRGEGLAI